jgi:putative ABC transport system ATP-binding protein
VQPIEASYAWRQEGTVLELRAVTKRYGTGANQVEALRGIDLTVPRGQFLGIMGPSGSGKSTLLNLVSALDVPSTGHIYVEGKDIAELGDRELTVFRRRRVGLVFQFFNLLPMLTALDNVLLPIKLERRTSAQDVARARELLQEVGVLERAAHHPHELSGGEMQRVAIARALVMRPSLILADEPTGNLDSATGKAILALLKRTCTTNETTTIMVTHDVEAARMGDRVLQLKDGRVAHDSCASAVPGPMQGWLAKTEERAAETRS